MLSLWGVALIGLHAQAAEKDTLNTDDVTFVKEAAADNMAKVKIAELGVKKAASTGVKEFAEMMVKDHTLASQELKELAALKGVDISAGIEPKQAERIQDLEKVSGAIFDRNFVDGMVSDHKNNISDFEEASAKSKDADVKVWVNKMIPTLKSHLDQANHLNGDANAAPGNANNTARNVRDRNDKTLTPFDQGGSKSDREITAQIRRGIMAENALSLNAQNVKIITVGGKVTLRGPVNNADEKLLIGNIAERTVPAANVDSQLEVK